MKTNLLKILCGLALLGAAVTASAQSTSSINFTLSDAGNNQTTISYYMAGPIVGSGNISYSANGGGFFAFSCYFDNFLNLSNFDPNNNNVVLPVSGFGTFNNPNGSYPLENHHATATVNGIQFRSLYGGSTEQIVLDINQPLGLNSFDLVTYQPGTDTATLDVPFSIFNPGSYQTVAPYYQNTGELAPTFTYNLNVEGTDVPEPSTWVMLVGGLGMLAFGQRFRRGHKHA